MDQRSAHSGRRTSVGTAVTDRRRLLADLSLALLAAVLMLCILFAGEEIGLSDNGDFIRVLKGSSLFFAETDKAFVYVGTYGIQLPEDSLIANLSHILFSSEGIRAYPNIQLLLVRLTAAANLLWNAVAGREPSLYRLWTLGVCHVLLYALALFALFRRLRLKNRFCGLAAKLLLVLLLCDIGYVAYFNSFYSEPLQIIGLVLCAAFGLSLLREETPKGGEFLGFVLSAVLYGCSKSANIPAAALFLLAAGLISWLKRRKAILLCLHAAAILALAGSLLLLPSWMSNDTDFNAVFYGVVRDVDPETAETYLADLGLDPGMAEFAGNHAYVDGVQTRFAEAGFSDAFFSGVSKASLLRFYLTHPACWLAKLRFSLNNSGMIRPYYLSNYDRSHPRYTLSTRFSLWSLVRQWLGTDTAVGNLCVLLGFLLLLLLPGKGKDRRSGRIAALALAGAWAYHLFIPYITNGEGDIAKHMFAMEQIADLMLLAILISALDGLGRKVVSLSQWIALAVMAGLLISPVSQACRWRRLEALRIDGLQPGSHLVLGTLEGSPLTWLVTDIRDGHAELLCTQIVDTLPFSRDNANLWQESSLRDYLNGEFPEHVFSESEQALLCAARHPVLLSRPNKTRAETGTLDFGCSHLAEYVGVGYERAYQCETRDMVSLPDAALIMRLSREGYGLADSESYWLTTPYFENGSMVRCVYPDGCVYFQDAKEARGVRPTVYLRLEDTAAGIRSGTGSLSDPFRLGN